MANIAKFNGRVIQKHDTAENWGKATNFMPLKGEIIVYEDTNQIKIGDGKTVVNDLPFAYPEDINVAGGTTAGSQTAAFGSAFNIPQITYDSHGRITGVTNAQVALPESPVPTVDTNTTYTFTDGTESFTVTDSDGGTQTVNIALTELHEAEGATDIPALQTVTNGSSFISLPKIEFDKEGRITKVDKTSVQFLMADNNTTYTFEGGEEIVKITPSINTVTGSVPLSTQTIDVVPKKIHDNAGGTNLRDQEPTHGSAFNIPSFTYDKEGRITGVGTTTVTLPEDNDTDTNTTYVFANGTEDKPNTFTVTPVTDEIEGDAIDVSIVPSIEVGVTSSGSGNIVTNVETSGKNGIKITKTSLASLGIGSPFHFQGTKTWAQLISLSSAAKGDVYNISDKDPTGKTGQNWVCIKAISGTAPGSSSYAEYWDALGGTMDLSNYAVLDTDAAQTFTGDVTFEDDVTFDIQPTVPGIKTSAGTGTKVFLDNGSLKPVSDFATSTQHSELIDEVNKKLNSGNDAVGYQDLAFTGIANSWSSLSIGKKSKNGILSLYKNNTYMDIKIDGTLSAQAELKIPAASGTLATREWVADEAFWKLTGAGTKIPADSNLNDYTTPGVYYVQSGTIAASVTNSPVTDSGYKLIVSHTYSTTRAFQMAFAATGNGIYYRGYNYNSGTPTWTEWKFLSDIRDRVTNLENGAVMLTGAQTITGAKTFESGITFYNNNATAGNIFEAIKFKSANNTTTFTPIQFMAHDANGSGIIIGAGGLTIIGGGESASNLANALIADGTSNAGSEHMHIAADSHVYIHSHANTIADRKTTIYDTNGHWTMPGTVTATGFKVGTDSVVTEPTLIDALATKLNYYPTKSGVTNLDTVANATCLINVQGSDGALTITKPSAANNNANSVLHLHHHSGNHASQLLVSSAAKKAYLRHANGTETFGDWDAIATEGWVTGKGYTTNVGTVTSINGAGASGSHLTVTGGAVTTSGTLTIGVESGYSIPSVNKQNTWDAAYGWGNHATKGYATETWTKSNFWHLNLSGTAISKNADLNTYTTPGSYYSSESAVSQTLSNCPHTSSGFRMIVMLTYGGGRVVQWVFPSSGAMYFRMYNGTSDTTWSDWRTIITDAGSRTIIGGLTFKNPSADTNSLISAIRYLSANNTTTFNALQLITGDVNGTGVLLGAGGTTIVGGGESAGNLWNDIKAKAGAQTESLHLANDGDITFHSNCQTISSRKTATFDSTGNWKIPGRYVGTSATSGSWYQGRDLATFQETRAANQTGYHALWSLKTTNGSWDFGEYESDAWYDIPVMTYITDTNYTNKNNQQTYQLKFPLASGTIATTSNIGDGTLTISTSGTGLSIGSSNASFKANASSNATIQVALDSSSAGNRAKHQVVLASDAGQINSEKFAVTSSGTVKSTIQYNSTYKAVEFVF